MLKYDIFLENKIIDKICESHIYFSPKVREILAKSNNTIANDLLNIEGKDIEPDITFVDIGKEGYLTFTTMRSIKNADYILDVLKTSSSMVVKTVLNDLYYNSSMFTNSRNEISLGRFVNRVFPNVYNDKEREEFVNVFKSKIENFREEFEIVSGNDINYWYSTNDIRSGGSLGNSCMNGKNFFQMYVNNPNICRMLVLKDGDILIGRALIWKVNTCENSKNKKFTYFLDRQYTSKQSDVNKFREYAIKMGWAYKTNNDHYDIQTITFENETFTCDMSVKLDNIDFFMYPYLDTFKRFQPEEMMLYNNRDYNTNSRILERTNGHYETINNEDDDGEITEVWSDYEGCSIPVDDAVWSDYENDYIHIDSSIFVDHSRYPNRIGAYVSGSVDLVEDYSGDWLFKDECVYSKIYNEYLWEEYAVKTIAEVDSNGMPPNFDGTWADKESNLITKLDTLEWYKKVAEKYPVWKEYDYILTLLIPEVQKSGLI